MIRTCLSAATVLSLIAGAAMAQTVTSTTTTTQSTVPMMVPVPGSVLLPVPGTVTETVTERTVGSDGVMTERTTTTGPAISPFGDGTTVERTTETTTIR